MQIGAEVIEMIELFLDVALGDPLSLVLVAFGGLFIGSSSLLVGYLALRAVIDFVTPTPAGGPPRQAR